jgi:hypothetical protein
MSVRPFPGYRAAAATATLANMSHPNRVPNLRRPFAICFGCDAVEALTIASRDWTLIYRQHRMFGYRCPSCQARAEQAAADRVTTPTVPPQSRAGRPSRIAE